MFQISGFDSVVKNLNRTRPISFFFEVQSLPVTNFEVAGDSDVVMNHSANLTPESCVSKSPTRCKYAIALYEMICLPANPNRCVETIDLQEFRRLVGVPPESYSRRDSGSKLMKRMAGITPSVPGPKIP